MNGRIGDRDENADIAAGIQRGRWGEDSTFTARKFAKPPGIRSIPNRGQSGPRLLLSDGTVPVDAAALKEAMLDHAVAKQQEEDC